MDAFFAISGFLAAFVTLRKGSGRTPPSTLRAHVAWLLPMWLHRMLRLMPTVAFVIFFYMKLLPLAGRGPFWSAMKQPDECEQYWWTVVLFVNNLVPYDSPAACYGVTWYLGNDMQFSLACPLLLALYRWRPVQHHSGLEILFRAPLRLE